MAVPTDYATLQTEISAWLHRTDLASRTVDFISYAEKRINKTLKLISMEKRATATLSTTSRLLGLPGDYIKMFSIQLNTSPVEQLKYVLPSEMHKYQGETTETNRPCYFTIRADIELNVIPDTAYTVEMHYVEGFNLSVANDTNWLLTEHPDVYLDASLIEGFKFIRNTEEEKNAIGRFNDAVKALKLTDSQSRNTRKATSTTELFELGGYSNFDIDVGY